MMDPMTPEVGGAPMQPELMAEDEQARRRRMMIQMLQGQGGGTGNAWAQLGTALGGLVGGAGGGGMKAG